MKAGSAEFGRAVASGDVTVRYTVTITGLPVIDGYSGDVSGTVVGTPSVSRQLVTNQPDETRSAPGLSARSCRLVLGGPLTPATADAVWSDDRTAGWLFDPYEPTSPLYRRGTRGLVFEVRQGLDLATSTETFETFTGTVDTVQVDEVTGSVSLTLIDERQQFRDTVDLPPVVSPQVKGAVTSRGPGLSAHWVMDYVARSAGYYQSPPPPPDTVVHISGHGSFWPEVGYTSSAKRDLILPSAEPRYAAGRWSPQVILSGGRGFQDVKLRELSDFDPTNADVDAFSAYGTLKLTSFYAEVWANAGPTGTNVVLDLVVSNAFPVFPRSYYLTVTREAAGTFLLEATATYIADYQQGSSRTAVLDGPGGAWHRIGVYHQYQPSASTPGTWKVTEQLYVDSVAVGPQIVLDGLEFTVPDIGYVDTVRVSQPSPGVVAENLSVVRCPHVPTAAAAFTPPAVATVDYSTAFVPSAQLDVSLNELTAVPVVGDKIDAWQVLQQLADAEQGVVGTTGRVLTFRNRETLRRAPTARVLSQADSAGSVKVTQSLAQLRNVVTAVRTSSTWPGPLNLAVAFNSYLPPVAARSVAAFDVKLPRAFMDLSTDQYARVAVPGRNGQAILSAAAYHGLDLTTATPQVQVVACNAPDGMVGDTADDYYLQVRHLSPDKARIIVVNYGTAPLYFVFPQGSKQFGDDLIDGSTPNNYATPQPYAQGVAGRPSLFLIGTPQNVTQETLTLSWPPSVDAHGPQALVLPANGWRQDALAVYGLATALLSDLAEGKPEMSDVQIVGDARLEPGDKVELVRAGYDQSEPAFLGDIADRNDGVWGVGLRAVARPGAWILGRAGRSELGVSTRL